MSNDSSASDKSEKGETPSEEARLVQWIQGEKDQQPSPPMLPPVSKEPYDPGRHFDETGRWLARSVVIVFGFVVVVSFLAIVGGVNAIQLDSWERLMIPSLTGLVGTAFGFYFRGRSDLKG